MDFECHVTINTPEGMKYLRCVDLAEELGWHSSMIDGDPVLGKGSRFYFTCHAREYIGLYNKMEHLVLTLKTLGFTVLRKKIELVMYDTKNMNLVQPGEDPRT